MKHNPRSGSLKSPDYWGGLSVDATAPVRRGTDRMGDVVGFHGTRLSLAADIVRSGDFRRSPYPWNWLGRGTYFWQEDPARAYQWAKRRFGGAGAVVEARIHLGRCLDLAQQRSLRLVRKAYIELKKAAVKSDGTLPSNRGNDHSLDAAVIEVVCANWGEFDTVRSAFAQGTELYPRSGFRSMNHVQIAVRNPKSIVGRPELWQVL